LINILKLALATKHKSTKSKMFLASVSHGYLLKVLLAGIGWPNQPQTTLQLP